MSKRNGTVIPMRPRGAGPTGRVRGKRTAPVVAGKRLVYVVPNEKWMYVDAQPVVTMWVAPKQDKVLLPGQPVPPPPGNMALAILTAVLRASNEQMAYERTAVAGFAVPVEDVHNWQGEPPGPVKDALAAFCLADVWPNSPHPLVVGMTMLMPLEFVEEGGGFGGEIG